MATSHLVREFLDARRHVLTNPETFRHSRDALLASDKREVLAVFEDHLQVPDDEERVWAIKGLALLYGREATDEIVRWINDSSPTVRYTVCGCLHDIGDLRVAPVLLDRLKNDADCRVRGMASRTLGQIGQMEALPDLSQTCQTDHEVDQHGHSPSSQAMEAMTSLLRGWVSQKIQGTPPKNFGESISKGELRGTVTAEEIPFDPEGRINRTTRYSHLPISSFGHGWSSNLSLQTSLISPFEIEVEYVDPTCHIQRIFVYQQIPDCDDVNWAVDTILDPTAMRPPPQL